MAYKVGVICKSCGQRIEIEDEYIRGIHAAEMAAFLYKTGPKRFGDFSDDAWQQILACENPDSGQTHKYTGQDLQLYDS